jgi:hypothetical protein
MKIITDRDINKLAEIYKYKYFLTITFKTGTPKSQIIKNTKSLLNRLDKKIYNNLKLHGEQARIKRLAVLEKNLTGMLHYHICISLVDSNLPVLEELLKLYHDRKKIGRYRNIKIRPTHEDIFRVIKYCFKQNTFCMENTHWGYK